MSDGTSNKVQAWLDEDGNHYPWMLELWKWQEERARERKARGEDSARPLDSFPKAKLSNLLRCLDKAAATPEVSERAAWLARQPLLDYINLSEEDPRRAEAALQLDVVGFIGRFTNWFLMRESIDELPIPYGVIYRALGAISLGEIDRGDIEGIKRHFFAGDIVDDVTGGT